MPSPAPASGRPPLRPSAREIVLFTVLALGLAWIVHVPVLLMGEGPGSTAYWLTSGFFMLTPSIAALLVVRYVWRPRHPARATGLPLLRPRSRGLLYCLLGVVLVPLLGTASALVAGALGVVELDLAGFSGIRQGLGDMVPDAAQPASGFPIAALMTWLGILLVGGVPTILLMFGEEWAWRGYLVPRLLPTGLPFTLLFSGLLWGVWHAPQLFIQYRFGIADGPFLVIFFAYLLAFGVVLGWLRLASGSMWPAMIAHGFGNVFVVVGSMAVMAADSPVDPLLFPGGTGGLVGLGVMAVLALVMLVCGGLKVRSFDSPQVRAGYERAEESRQPG